jgi:indolepyruvate ferredoxin oxidoreductase
MKVVRAIMSEAKARFLRGTTFDLFGYATVRRCELDLVDWYEGLLDRALPSLCLENEPGIRQIVNLPGDIRGYEDLSFARRRLPGQRAKNCSHN